MGESHWTRRSVLRAIPGLAMGAAAMTGETSPQAVKWSTGSNTPKTKAPPNATDCHFHIYDARYPADPKAVLHPGDATVEDYRRLQKRLGITRCVIVQPSTYGVDNRLLLDCLAIFGIANARGVAVVNTGVRDAELRQMHAAGVRGIRFNLVQAGATTPDMIDPLARRVAPLGWHIQIQASADQIVAGQEVWQRVPCPVVFDHMGHVPEPQGTGHPVFAVICRLMQKGRAWVKISGFYMETAVGPPTYSDRVAIAKAYAKEAPERLVWGSDWPHPTEKDDGKPDDALLFDLLATCIPDEGLRNRVLVEHAAALYGF